jgi:hypothetical protein
LGFGGCNRNACFERRGTGININACFNALQYVKDSRPVPVSVIGCVA